RCFKAVRAALRDFSLTGHPAVELDPEDLVQDLYVKILESKHQATILAHENYFRSVAHNLVADRGRIVRNRQAAIANLGEVPSDHRSHTDLTAGREEACSWCEHLRDSDLLNDKEKRVLAYMLEHGLDCDRKSPDRADIIQGTGLTQKEFY